MGVRIRIAGYMMMALSGLPEEEVPEFLARDGVHLSPFEVDEARRRLGEHSTSFRAEGVQT